MVRFKKGSVEAKRYMARIRGLKKSSSNRVKKGGVNMARRKAVKKRTSYKRSSSGQSLDLFIDIGMPAVYGYGRNFLSEKTATITNKIPLGLISDEAFFGFLGYLGYKKLRNAKVKKACKNIIVIESARAGQTVQDFGFQKVFTGR